LEIRVTKIVTPTVETKPRPIIASYSGLRG
jgi:hypothetical protein